LVADDFTPERVLETFKEEFGQDITDLWDPDDISLELHAPASRTYARCERLAT